MVFKHDAHAVVVFVESQEAKDAHALLKGPVHADFVQEEFTALLRLRYLMLFKNFHSYLLLLVFLTSLAIITIKR